MFMHLTSMDLCCGTCMVLGPTRCSAPRILVSNLLGECQGGHTSTLWSMSFLLGYLMCNVGFTKKLMNSDSPEIRILANLVARDAG